MWPLVVIVATAFGGEVWTSKPMTRVVAEMLLALYVKREIAKVEIRPA
jgi:hypothetical protein